MRFDIITIFPHIFDSYFQEGILSRALGFKKKVLVYVHDLRKYTRDEHRTVDDRPYGGGPGMVLMAEPIIKAIVDIKRKTAKKNRQSLVSSQQPRVILFSAKGRLYTQDRACELSSLSHLILICGRYEGVDERVLNFVDDEVSLGNFVLTGGEIPAMAVIDSVTRLIPGVLGCDASSVDESFATPGVLEYPHFTRPEKLKLTPEQSKFFVRPRKSMIPLEVPHVLLSGHHGEIDHWRVEQKGSVKS